MRLRRRRPPCVASLPAVLHGDSAPRGVESELSGVRGSVATPMSAEWQARAQILEDELERLYPGRVLGVCAHLQGTRDGTSFPALWQVL